MIEWILWWRFLWRQKRGKAACAVHEGRLWFVSDTVEFEKARREALSDMWPVKKT